MRMRNVTFCQIAALVIILALALPTSSQSGVFWTDDFENHLNPTGSGPWDTGGCDANVGVPGIPDGCVSGVGNTKDTDGYNPGISTDIAVSGTHSLRSSYNANCGLTQVNPNAQGCGTYINRFHQNTRDVWMRWWIHFPNLPQNQVFDNTTGSKQMYNKTVNGSGMLIFWHVDQLGASLFGDDLMVVTQQSNYLVNCQAFGSQGTVKGMNPDTSCKFETNLAHIPLNDGKWHCLETHANMGTNGNADGLLEIWVDGTQTLRYINVPISGPSETGLFGEITHYDQMGGANRYIDDLAVGDARIGCSGSPSSNPPAAPTALTVR